MRKRLLATRFHIPAWQPSGVERRRLLELLDQGLEEEHSLTLISAPAGYGKTTLAASWIANLKRQNRQCAWVSISSGMSDPNQFFSYWLTAVLSLAPSLSEHFEPVLHHGKLPPLEALMDDLINHLASSNVDGLIFLDDYHLVTCPEVHEAMEYFIENKPVCFHPVILTREDPPLPLARMRGRGQLTEIRARDLRFTLEEAGRFFDAAFHDRLGRGSLQLLEERTEGWAVGLQLAALALQGQDDPESYIQRFRGSHRTVLDYLAGEVLASLGEDTRRFLFWTSVMDWFNADACRAVSGRDDAADVLAFLEQSNMFIVPLDDERNWYRYHHLFSDYLRSQLSREEQSQACLRAAAWYESRDLIEQAVDHALASRDADAAAGYLGRALNRDSTWSSGNMGLLSSWLDALPSRTLEDRPQLCLDASRILYLKGRFDQAEARIAQAEHILERRDDFSEKQGLAAAASIYRGAIAAVRGQSSEAMGLISGALEELPQENHLVRGRAFFSLGLANELTGQLEQAVDHYLEASEEAEAAGVLFLAVHARCAAAQVQIQQGRLYLAEEACQKAIMLAHGQEEPPLGLANVIRGGIALERNDLERAEEYIEKGMRLARSGSLMDDVILGLAFLGRLYTAQGLEEAAGAAIREAVSIVELFRIPRLSALLAAYQARLQLRFGHLKPALQWAEEAMERDPADSHEYEMLTMVRALLAAGRLEPVLPVLEHLGEKSSVSGNVQLEMEVQMLMSLYYQALGEQETAENWLGESIRSGEAGGFARIYLDEGQPMLDLLPSVRSDAPEYVDALVSMLSEETGVEVSPLDQLIEPLSEQELRVFKLIAAGRSNREIADELVISVGTAKWHVHNIFQKLGVSSRPQAIVRARELGL